MRLASVYSAKIVSAHRTPDRMVAFAKGAEKAGFKVIIAGAGGAAHLPGMTAAFTALPVLGVPVASKALSGQDSLLSIVQMPAGVPVGTLAIGEAGRRQRGAARRRDPRAGRRRTRGPPGGMAGRTKRRRRRSPDRSAEMNLAPGSVIGILGAGQLGRMLAVAGAKLGLRTHVYAPDADAPADDVARQRFVGSYDDFDALARFAAGVDVITYEFESVPAEAVEFLATLRTVRPRASALRVAQDRLSEKTFLSGLALRRRRFGKSTTRASLRAAVAALGTPAILKTRRFGYDGKGQARIDAGADLAAVSESFRGQPCILEGFRPFRPRSVDHCGARRGRRLCRL